MGVLKWLFKGAIVALLEGGAWILTVKGALLMAKTTENGF